ncbi:MAG: Gldg family protein [Akkermansiaceae bacterium]
MNPLKVVLLALSFAGLLFFGLSFGINSLEPYRWYTILATVAAISFVPDSRIIRTGFVTAVLAALVFFVTDYISTTPAGIKALDLTEDNRYTLTDGTRAILSELTEPVTINYYVTRDVDGTPPEFERYIPRVDNFLREIKNLAKDDLITLNFIDPEPDTDEEDAALLDQVSQIDVTRDDQMIFGASISSLDKKTVIPFFNPAQETQLEYSVISAIAEVSTRNVPVVGLVTAHNLVPTGPQSQSWLFFQLMRRTYDVVDLTMNPTATLDATYESRKWGDAPDYLDPEKIPVILVVHPAGITPEAEFALDQYLLRGGTVIACVDPMSMAALQSAPRSPVPGMPPQGGTPRSSTLPKLFEKHRINFDTSKIIVDRKFAYEMDKRALFLDENAVTVKDDISISSIKSMIFFLSGGFSGKDGKPMGPGLEVSKIIESSYQYAYLDADQLTTPQGQQQLRFALGSKRESDQKQCYVALLSGTFPTAFPDGNPAEQQEEEDKQKEEDKQEEEKETKPKSLQTGTSKGNLYLIADSDLLADPIAYRPNRFTRTAEPFCGNGPFIFNILDQAVGSKHLIGARARTPVYREFTVLKELEAELDRVSGEKIKKYQKDVDEALAARENIRSQMTKENLAQLSAEYLEKNNEITETIVEANRSIRKEKKAYKSQTDALKAEIFWRDILYVPLGVILIGLTVFVIRKRQTNAR